ncbi:hypothetical protein ACIOKD_18110 [Streptomyces sp. NPDC087844]|uniref:hypothetical protein n=1 Tax=Streptomyces sp. NPDC087844 TaxID=3365805 RepID=UPI003813E0D2
MLSSLLIHADAVENGQVEAAAEVDDTGVDLQQRTTSAQSAGLDRHLTYRRLSHRRHAGLP